MKIVKILWWLFVIGLLSVALLFCGIWRGWWATIPPVEELENPISRYASQVISADGMLMGTFSLNENRLFVRRDEIAPCVFHALVATEDRRFYDHSGVDMRALARAAIKRGLMGRKEAGGGSTITQQLAKQLYTHSCSDESAVRIWQKAIEWVIAVKLERHYSKDEILDLYLNYFDFLHQAVGIRTAARVYFDKEPAALQPQEAAMLVGMCKNPSYYNPLRDSVRVKSRRNIVLELMAQQGYLTAQDASSLQEKPLGLRFRRISHKDGIAAYYREYLRRVMTAQKPERGQYASWQKQEYYDDSTAWVRDPLYGWCYKNRKKDGSPYNIYTDGLKIYASIDSRMQHYAERAVREHVQSYLQPVFAREKHLGSTSFNPYCSALGKDKIRELLNRSIERSERYRTMRASGMSEAEIKRFFETEKVPMTLYTTRGEVDTMLTPRDSVLYYKAFLRTGFMSMDPKTGEVKAYVGGLDYAHFQYDMCTQGRRQVGSTIKPYLYALAMENGYTPCDEVLNVQSSYTVGDTEWTPRNTSHARYGEMVTLKWALSQSNNWVSAHLINELGPSALVQLMRTFGIRSLDVYPSLSLCLGTADISVSEMVSAYTAFVNKGIRTEPLLVTRIENGDGEVVTEFHPRMNEAITAETSYKMIEMMRGVVDGGTAGRLRSTYGLQGPICAKTGTTNDISDAWFMGYVPRLVSGCWVGGEERDIHFNQMSMGQGAAAALPIWGKYMKYVYSDKSLGYSPSETFDVPADFHTCGDSISAMEEEIIEEIIPAPLP